MKLYMHFVAYHWFIIVRIVESIKNKYKSIKYSKNKIVTDKIDFIVTDIDRILLTGFTL